MIDTTIRQWCGHCAAATVTWICPGCRDELCSECARECPDCDVEWD